jgi:hypothetical protein
MKDKQSDARSGRASPLSPDEGLELIKAFSKIGTGTDRQKVIELAKRLSTSGAKAGA